MAYTLADYARLAPDDLTKGVVDIFRRESPVMDLMSFENADQLSITVLRTKSLPSVGFRKINSSFAESKGTVEPVQESVFDLGGYVDVDKMMVKAKSITDQRALQTDMFVTAISYEFQDYFINGDPASDPDGFAGLFYRIKNYHTAQHINANGLDVSPDASGLAANQATLIDDMQALIHKCDGHQADAIWCNDTFLLRLMSALRASGLMDTTQDNYGRWVATYGPNGPKLYDIGVKADQSTNIITNTETNDGSALTGGGATSAYAIRFGEKYLQGFQLYSLDVNDVGLLEDGVTYRTVIDWPVGIMITNPRSVARLSGVIAA